MKGRKLDRDYELRFENLQIISILGIVGCLKNMATTVLWRVYLI